MIYPKIEPCAEDVHEAQAQQWQAMREEDWEELEAYAIAATERFWEGERE